MKNSLIWLIIIACRSAIAQPATDSLENQKSFIVHVTEYNRGIYKTFDEFRNNDPSGTADFKFDGKRLWILNAKTGVLEKVKKKEVWGFSDGSRIFVRWRKYNELLAKGRYCYFIEKGTRVSFIVAFPLIIPVPTPYTDEVIVSFNTGQSYLLTKKILKQILTRDDPELLADFLEQKQKRKKLTQYLMRYNERNTDKIR